MLILIARHSLIYWAALSLACSAEFLFSIIIVLRLRITTNKTFNIEIGLNSAMNH